MDQRELSSLLLALTGICCLGHFRPLAADLSDHRRAYRFFSTIAATSVLGRQFLQIAEIPSVTVAPRFHSLTLRFVLTYAVFSCTTAKQVKPSLKEGLHGSCLLTVVGTQSVSLLGAILCDDFSLYRDAILFLSLTLWPGGGMLYTWIISLTFNRYCFEPVDRDSMSPPDWINMGAMGISALAGATLLDAAEESTLLYQFLPFIKGTTLLRWVVAT